MDPFSILIAILVGIVQGIFEWLPISSEGNLTILLTALGTAPDEAVRYSLFLHLGTAFAAISYYRHDIRELLRVIPTLAETWRSESEFWFLAVGTVVSGVVGLLAYAALIEAVTELEGAILVILIGVLLIGTGIFQRLSTDVTKEVPAKSASLIDAILVGIGQGVAVLPGVSRSGTTVGVLLLRGYPGDSSFRLSFLLSIPAALGAGLLVVVDSGAPAIGSPLAGLVALVTSAVVGYVTIDALMRVVERISFWVICVVLGGLAVTGGLLVI